MAMYDASQSDLVEQARTGDAQSLELLTVEVRRRVCAYGNRVLLNSHEADDLAQDTVAAVLRSFGNFRQVDRFWPWVFTIASNQLRQNFRRQSLRKTVPMSNVNEIELQSPPEEDDGCAVIARQELAELTRKAMSQVGDRHRMVLALRFYEDLPHAQIAQAMGCSELTARVVFHRAKQALTRELKRLGVNKTMLTAALGAFGGVTMTPSSTSAMVTISAGALSESLLTWFWAKMKWAAAACLLLIASLWMIGMQSAQKASGSGPAAYVHFVHQSLIRTSDEVNFGATQSKGAYEQWFRFSNGLGSPMVFRMQRWSPDQTERLCWWVENGEGNYYVHGGEKQIYINNSRMRNSNTSTRILPNDSKEMCDFVQQVEESQGQPSASDGIAIERDPETGQLLRRVDTRFAELGPFVTTYDYDPHDDTLWDTPSGMKTIDRRDPMHKRGWTHFRIDGQMGRQQVTGAGQIPFVARELVEHPPWVRFDIAGRTVAVDDGRHAMLLKDKASAPIAYQAGGLFRGLLRPWTGFHTLDTIRRDAAEERLWFSIAVVKADELIQVTVVNRRESASELATYLVDTENDLLQEVKFWRGNAEGDYEAAGEWRFTYLNPGDVIGPDFTMPDAAQMGAGRSKERPSLLWPFQLIEAIGIAASQESTVRQDEGVTTK